MLSYCCGDQLNMKHDVGLSVACTVPSPAVAPETELSSETVSGSEWLSSLHPPTCRPLACSQLSIFLERSLRMPSS